MTREETIEAACQLMAQVYHAVKEYDRPCDGFCHNCPPGKDPARTFRNAGHVLRYMAKAIIRQLREDGFTPFVGGLTMPCFVGLLEDFENYPKQRGGDLP